MYLCVIVLKNVRQKVRIYSNVKEIPNNTSKQH